MVVAVVGIIRGSVLVDVEVDEEQRKDKEHSHGNADCDSDAGFVGETMRGSAGGTEFREIRRRLIGEDIRRLDGER